MQPSPRDPATAEVFISYRTAETSADAQQLYRLLEERGLNVFLDAGRLRAGDRWDQQIEAALASPGLAVGIVLMAPPWFENFIPPPNWTALEGHDRKPGIVVWEEVRSLRERAQRDSGCTVMPVVVRTKDTGDTVPELPPASCSGHAELADLRDWFGDLHYTWIPPKVLTRFDDLVDEVYATVRDSVLRRPLRRTSGITAERTAPLPLRLLDAETPTRRALLHYAEMVGAFAHDHRLEAILGQEALLRHDFPTALQHLGSARTIARSTADETDERFRSQLWHAHALNLFTVASLRGGRPRRRQITEASELLRHVLLKAIEIEATGLTDWSEGDGEQARADRESTAYVTELTVLLLWLLWQDFFRARNVRVPDTTAPELDLVRKRLRDVGDGLRRLAASGVALDAAASECRFFVECGYLDGLPPELTVAARWSSVEMLDGVDTFVRELVA